MRYLSRKLLLCLAAVLVMASLAGAAFAIDTVGAFSESVSSEEAGSYAVLSSDMVSSEWCTSVESTEITALTDSKDIIVLTIPRLSITGVSGDAETKEYIAKVSYDFSVLSGSVYADSENTLTFYPQYDGTSAGTAKFYDASMNELTAYAINTNRALTAGYIVMTLTSGDSYAPFVAVRSTTGLVITADSTDLKLVAGSSDVVKLSVQNYTGNVTWEIITSSDSSSVSSRQVKSSVTSSDNGHSAVLTLTVPSTAEYRQSGGVELAATDQATGAQATIWIYYEAESQLTLTLASQLVSVDLNETITVGVNIKNAASGDLSIGTSELLWTEIAGSETSSRDLIINPYDSFLEGSIWPVNITAQDWRGRSGDKRGQASATVNVYVYRVLSLDVSPREFTITSSDIPDVTFTASDASGDLSFEVSESWAAVSGSKFVVNTIDESLQGTTQTVTVTARDDRGRAGNSRGESSLTLSVTISNDFVPALELAISPVSLMVNYNSSATAELSASNAKGAVSYSSSASWAAISGNTITVNYDSAYAGQTLTATITATDAGRTTNNTATATLSAAFDEVPDPVLPFELAISTASLTVNYGGSATATLSPSNALGEVNYSSSASWAAISGNTITVNYDSSYAGTTQSTTITGTDSGRTSDNTDRVNLSVTFGPRPDRVLELTVSKPSVSINVGGSDTVNLTLGGAESVGVAWSYVYDSVPSGASSSGNPLGLSFTNEGSTSAVLNVNPDRTAVPGDYTINISTATTSGTSTGGDGTVTITVNPPDALAITASRTSISCAEGESFTIDFSAQNELGTVSWDIVNTSWGTDDAPVILSRLATGTNVTLEGQAVTAGTYSFTVMAYDGSRTASANVSLTITEPKPVIIHSGDRIVPSRDIRPVELTQELLTALRASLGLTASDEIHSLTTENILSPVKPDALTETAMNQRGYQLAANLSRISVSESGLYAFVFTIPDEYVGFSMNDLAIFSTVLESNGATVSAFYASALGADGLNEGDLLGTDGRMLTNAASDLMAVVELDAGTTSGTFFGSIVIPPQQGKQLPELQISVITQESFDEILPQLRQEVSYDTNYDILPLRLEHIGVAQEATEETKQAASQQKLELKYKLNSISVDVTANYVFEITLPDEYVGIPLEELKLMVAEQPQMSSAGFSAAADPFIYLEVTQLTDNKVLGVVLATAGQSFSMFLCKLIIALVLGGCETGSASYAGYGIIALVGAVILLGSKMLRRK